jgi:cell division protein FtsX
MKKILFGIPILLILTGVIMDNTRNKIWFEKSILIETKIEQIDLSLNDIANHFQQLIQIYPGITSAELIDQGKDYVTIKTNEGLMKRTNVSVNRLENKIVIELDEEYKTSAITTHSHIIETFETKNDKIELHIEINNHKAPGFLGFLLRNFGSKNIGNGFLESYKKMFENKNTQ